MVIMTGSIHNGHKGTQKVISQIAGLLVIATYILGSVIFNLYLNWYDTGEFSSDGSLYVAVGGVVFGSLALKIGRGLYQRHGRWPHNRFIFLTRLMALSVLYIALSFAVGSGTVYVLSEVVNGGGLLAALRGVALILMMAMFYSLMVIPFGVVVGVVVSLLLRLNLSAHPLR